MAGTAAVLFTITIPTAAEEQRLKSVYLGGPSLKESIEAMPSPSSLPTIQIDLAERNKLELIDLPIDTDMEHVLHEILRKFQVHNAVWLSNGDATIWYISFTVEFNEVYENIYAALQNWGIGDREGTTVSVVNCIANKSHANREESEEQSDFCNEKHSAWTRFMNTVQSRLNVAKVVRDVQQDAAITFDFCILLVSAAILASFGLIENSTIFLASSMLISPLMGPIIAAIFGTVIKERTLRRLGMCNELIGILLATLVGFLFGLVICTTDKKYGIGEGLTEEMLSRCDLHSLIVGVFTAIPSGAAAAIGILGGNVGSLVGVAISASLLPPAVNSGLLWALACIYKVFEQDDSRYLYVVKSHMYSENQATELAILGSISMCLTISNVICVYAMGILVLKVKEIAPVIARNNSSFWKYDIKLARERPQHNIVSTDAAIMDEFANLPKEDQKALGLNCDLLRHLDESAYQHTWSPLSNRHSLEAHPHLGSFCTINRLEKLYTTISNPSERRHRNSVTRRPQLLDPTMHNLSPASLSTPRPRFATMPSNIGTKEEQQTVINMPGENATKRFTVTPTIDNQMLQ